MVARPMSLDVIFSFGADGKTISITFNVCFQSYQAVLSKSHINIKSFSEFGFLEIAYIDVITIDIENLFFLLQFL